MNDIHSITSANVNNQTIITITLSTVDRTCPYCSSNHTKSKGYYSKHITLPNNCFSNTTVILKVPRLSCLDCRHSFSNKHMLTPKNNTLSYSMINTIMDLLKDTRLTFLSTANICGISSNTVIRVFDKYCHIPRFPLPEVLCMDEVYTKHNSTNCKFSCVFYDFFKQTIVDITPSRRKDYLHMYLSKINEKERNGVKLICIDMYLPYKQLIKLYFKKATICVDSFHVIKHLNDSLNKLRIRIMKSYPTDSIEYYLLKQFKNLLFDNHMNLDNKGKFNKKLKRIINYRQLLELMMSISDELRNGFELKQRYTLFNMNSSLDEAKEQYDDILNAFIAANIPEYQEFTTSLTNWKTEIINSFIIYKGRRINNGIAESVNSRIKEVLFNSKGIKDDERRRKRIMYAINKTGFSI